MFPKFAVKTSSMIAPAKVFSLATNPHVQSYDLAMRDVCIVRDVVFHENERLTPDEIRAHFETRQFESSPLDDEEEDTMPTPKLLDSITVLPHPRVPPIRESTTSASPTSTESTPAPHSRRHIREFPRFNLRPLSRPIGPIPTFNGTSMALTGTLLLYDKR
jgi:hypothetical protein